MSQRRLVLIILLVAATGFLVMSFVNRAGDAARPAASAGGTQGAEATEAGVRPGKIVWANWHDRKKPEDPARRPGAMSDLSERERPKLPEEVRRRLERSFRGTDVYIPEIGR